jgi:hypothetical protein
MLSFLPKLKSWKTDYGKEKVLFGFNKNAPVPTFVPREAEMWNIFNIFAYNGDFPNRYLRRWFSSFQG